VIVNLWVLFFFSKNLQLRWNEIFRALLYGMIAALIIKWFIYGIWRQMNIDFYFFEIRILGKNVFENFENMYGEFIKNFSLKYSIFFAIGTIILPATLEEVWKLLSLRVITIKSIGWSVSTIREYIYRMFIIALWFSFLENFFYIGYYIEMWQSWIWLVQLVILRIIMSTTSHLFFSGIMAYFYARFMFGKYDIVDTGGFNSHKKVVSFLKSFHIFYSPFFSIAYNSRLFFLGLILAIGGHVFYNLMIYVQFNFVALVFLIVWWWLFIYYILSREVIDKNLWIIQEKIALMKEMRMIQKRKDELFWNTLK
jgi:hypothetical protein